MQAFVVKNVSNGTLRIGADAASATLYNGWTNNTIDATHRSYWTPAANAYGTLNAFAVVAKDNNGQESATPVQATVTVTPVNDAPTMFQPQALSFAAKADYATGWDPRLVTSADVNGDGKADLIVANWGSNSVSVLLNNGDGTFATKVDYATGSYPSSVVSADVNGDGKADLIVPNLYNNSVSVLLNNGNGTFAVPVDYATGSYPRSVTSTDVNGDGKADLIVANQSSNSVSVLLNNGDGTFAAKVDYATSSNPYSLTSADVNGDGKADLIIANLNSQIVSVFLNTAHPAITSYIEMSPVHVSSDIVINDPDGNAGWNGGSLKVQITANAEAADSLTIATSNPGANGIWLDVAAGNKLMAGILELGSASAASVSNGDAWSFSFNANATNALVQDVARAVVFSNSSFTPGTNARSITFTATDNVLASSSLVETVTVTDVAWAPTLTGFSGAVGSTSEDTSLEISFASLQASGNEADLDGTVDAFVVKNVSSGTLRIGADAASATLYNCWTNNTIDATHRAYWTPAANLNGTLNAFAVVAKDNSGLESATPVQVTVAVTPVNDAPVILQPQTLSFVPATYAATNTAGSGPFSVTSSDVNGDGNADLIVVNRYSNTVSVLLNQGNGTFAAKVDYATGSNPMSVTSADVNGDGMVDLIVSNGGVNGVGNTVSVLLNQGNGTFAPKVDYVTGTNPVSVTSTDVNGDGKADLLVSNYTSSSVSVLLNQGSGTFAAKVDYTTGWNPYSVASADVNGDGKADLIVANFNSNTVSVLLNQGGGTFAPNVDYVTGSGPVPVTSGDVNGDGQFDLIVANFKSGTVSVLLNQGAGTFAGKVDYLTGSNPHSVTSIDVNGDGKRDIVTANYTGNTVSVLLNKGTGTFATKVDYAVGINPESVISADVNGDGKADLLVANAGDNTVSVLLNTAYPAITSYIEMSPVHVSSDIVIYDPDGNANWNGGSLKVQITAHAEAADSLTIATSNPGANGIWLDVAAGNKLMAGILELGSASAASVSNGDAWSFSFNANATNALVQDVARAVVFSNSSFTPGTNARSITFTATDNAFASASLVETVTVTAVDFAPTLTAFSGVVGATSEDTSVEITFASLQASGNEADIDGTVDAFLVKNVSSGTLRIGIDAVSATLYDGWKNNTIDATHRAYWTPAANVNGTMNAFVVVAKDNSGLESAVPVQATVAVTSVNDGPVMMQPQALSFAAKVDYGTGSGSYSLTGVDVNGDGKVDLIVTNWDNDSISVLTNNGDGTFAAKVDYTVGGRASSVTNADVNGDGKADLIVANYNSNSVSVLINNGNGTFAAKVDYVTGSSPYSVTSADVNGDGQADLIVANYYSNSVSVLTNNGNGTFASKVDYATGSNTYSVISVDVNGDGKVDLIAVNSNSNSISVLTNNGDGTFAAKVDYAMAYNPRSAVSADVNGDGKADLIVVNTSSNSVSVLTNNGDGTFAAKVDYATGSYPMFVTNADVNGDNKVDIIVANYSGNSVSVFKNNGTGTFVASLDYSTGSNPHSMISADVNGDGKADLIVANSSGNSVSVLINTTHPAITSYMEMSPVHVSSDIVINDPDGNAGWNGGALNVQITGNAEAADSLTLASTNPGGSGIWLDTTANKLMAGALEIGTANAAMVSNGDAWSFTFNASATNALVQDVVRAVVFSNSSNTPGTADRGITFTATDNALASASLVEKLVFLPTLSSTTPADNATTLAVDSNIMLSFNKVVQAGSGSIVITSGSGDTLAINVADTSQVSFSGNTVTINPAADLQAGTIYNVQMASGVIKDLGGNAYAGISDTATLNVATAAHAFSNNGQPLYNYNGHTYQLTSSSMSWAQAEAEAVAHGGHLASLNSAAENQWVFSAFGGSSTWIGFNDIQQEGQWVWTDGSAVTYTNWNSGEPNNSGGAEDTAHTWGGGLSTWNDLNGNSSLYGIIEYPVLIAIPTFTALNGALGSTIEDNTSPVEITFAALQASGDEADADGTVDAFVVKSVSNGTLNIGADAASATAWDAVKNNTIDATHRAFWLPSANLNGTLEAFAVVARDNMGQESSTPVQATVTVTSVNDAPGLIVGGNVSLDEGTTFNHQIVLGDPDPNTYHFTVNWGDGSADTLFDTQSHSPIISHLFADNGTHTVTVTVDDLQGQANSIENGSFQVTVNNVAPTASLTGVDRLNTGSMYTLNIGTVVDPGTDTRTAYTIDWGDGATVAYTPAEWAAVAGTFTHTYTASSGAETGRTITASATDEDGTFVLGSKYVTINRAPSDIYLGNAGVVENSVGGTVVGTLYSTDDEGTWGHSYQLLDDAGGRFVLVGNQINVAEGASLDYETATTHTIRVSSTDSGGLSVEKQLIISVADMGPDLVVTQVTTPAGVVAVDAGNAIEVSWTLATQGAEPSNAAWYDRIYLDNPDTPYLDRLIGDYQVSAHLPFSTALDRIQTIQVPLDMQGTFRVVVVADIYNQVLEGTTGEENNTTYGSGFFTVLNTNLQVESVTAPTSGFAGREIEVQWVVKNLGNASTPVPYWYDQLYLSSDTTLDSQDIALVAVQNASYLDIGQGYTNKARVTLPQGFEGSYHILVKTDAYGYIPEGAGESDNVTASSVLDIQPIPLNQLSDLAVVSVASPSQALSGQNMPLTYTIDNAGMAAITGNSTVWVERMYMSADDVLDGSDRLLNTVVRDVAADKLPKPGSGSHFTTTEKVTLPVGVEGNYYFFVTVSPVSPVSNAFTSNDTAHTATPTLVRLTPPPDLAVSSISAPATAIAGYDLTLSYRVVNSGSTTTPNSGWFDALYLSSDAVLDASDTKLQTLWHSGTLAPGVNGYYDNTMTVRLADSLQGSYYLIAATDSSNEVFETNKVNNTLSSAKAISVESHPADLLVTDVTAPTVAQAGTSMRISWTVQNQGIWETTVSQWFDRVVYSVDAVLGNGDDSTLATFSHTGVLQSGQSYLKSELISLPENVSGQYQLFVVTDSYNHVYEASQENNNARLLGVGLDGQPGLGIQMQAQPTADLQISSITALPVALSGGVFTVNYSVLNGGLGRTNADWWMDSVILSKDEIWGNADDVNLGSVYHSNRLLPGESYKGTASFDLPIDLQGDYHVGIRTDVWGQVTELNAENNNQGVATGITTINLSPTPDLVMSTLQARDQGVSGQSLQVDWTVHNNGSETSGGWRQVFYLSRDGVLDRGADIYLGYADSQIPLATNGDATYSQSFRIPYGISGNYYVFGVVDSSSAIYERGGESNNSKLDATPVQITPVTPVDLVAGVMTVPQNGVPGAQAIITYTVTNQSAQDVSGSWQDSLYISKDAVWDLGDPLFSRVGISGPLASNTSYTQTVSGALPGVASGNYYVIVRSDIFNQISETSEANNLAVSLNTTRLDVKALALGGQDAASFSAASAVYYRVDVAAGETLRLNFDRAGTTGRSELFVSYGTMPGRSDFDYRYTVADSPDQKLVITNTKAGSYYVMAYNASGATDNYAISADTLQFSITDIGTTAGSNKGQVTVRIDGAKFTTHTAATLVGTDGVAHAARQVFWKDSTELWATFDLRGLGIGAYDVKLDDAGRSAVMNDSFIVNSGEVGHVEFQMETPSALRPGQVGTVRVSYQNLGSTDVVAPLLTVSGNALLKMPGDASFGGTSLQLLGINSEGPAGILSPGAQGSFQLFFKPDFTGGGTVNLGVSSQKADQVIDWNTILESSKPANISQEAWTTVKANLIAQLGTTTTDYQNNLAANATALDQLESRTSDVAKLFSLDFQKASDTGALLRPATLGVLGYSHTFTWDITAASQTDSSVLVNIAGVETHFTLQSDGSYKLVGQGTATLAKTGGAFAFHQQNGTRILFNLDGTFSEIRDGNGQGVQATYDGGHLIQVSSSNGNTQNFTYNSAGRLTQQTDQAGRIISYTYDSANEYLTSAITSTGTTGYSYITTAGSSLHRISSMTLADGTVRHYEYDASGHLVKESINTGAEAITYSYIGINEVIATDATGAQTHLWMNGSGQIAQLEDALGHVSQLHYDINGNMIGIVHADGTSTGIQYDTSGHPTSVQDALGQTVSYSYDAQFGHLAQVTDQRGNPVNYSYDSQGNLSKIIYADGHSESYSYDTAGHLTADVNRNGQSVTYTYDNIGHITQKSYADGTTAKFTYDGHGNLITAVDTDSSTSFQYDTADRLTKVTDADGRWLSYQYDTAGHRTQMADQAGHITNYSYDTLGHLSRVTDGTGNLIAAYSYDAAGHLNRGDNGNGTYTTYEYDAAGQLTHLINYKADSTINSRFDYTYDVAGHRTSETTLDGTSSYEYDAIGQLTGVTLSTGHHIAYHYDAAGNRTAVDDGGVATNYATNNLNEYTGVGNAIYSYDTNGNLTGKSENGVTTSYAYDAENHLLSVTTPSDTWNYEYDALGNRIASVHNGARTEYQLDPTGLVNVAGEYDGSGNLMTAYTYGLGLESQTSTGGASYYYDYNAIGSAAGLTGSAGTYLNKYSYLPFGENLTTTETVANSFEYVGQWGVMDAGNGLDFMRARYYSCADGRFILTDPLGVNGGNTNLYVYSFNNPNSFIDPSGNLSIMAVLQTAITARDGAYTSINSGAGIGGTIGGAAGAVTGTAVGGAVGGAVGRVAGATIGGAIGGPIGAYVGGLVGGLVGGNIGGDIGGTIGQRWGQSLGDNMEQKLDKALNDPENQGNPDGGVHGSGGGMPGLGGNVPGSGSGAGGAQSAIPVIRPSDPNDILGPQGFGDDHWTTSQNALPYTIHYENQATATAPAQEVTITQTLDSDLNASSFRLGDFGWGDIYITVPDGVSFYIDRIDLTATKGYMVDVIAGVDVAKHEAYWSFTTIDPTTGEIPVDPTIGFLPTNVTKGTGEGFVNYTVHANADAPTGTVIDAKATIVFTTQEPIDTPAIFNTLDASAPESHLEAVAVTTVESAQFLVRWTGSDTGSAIASYTIYVSDNGGTYTPWLEKTTLTEATYAGQPGHSYAFYSVATDNAGNTETAPAQADLAMQVTAGALLSDTVSPHIQSVALPADGKYGTGQSLDIKVQLTEPTVVDVAGVAPVIKLTFGSTEVDATYFSGSGSDTITFRHVVAAGEHDSDGITVASAIIPNSSILRDVAGNPLVDFGFTTAAAAGILVDNPPTGEILLSGIAKEGQLLTADAASIADADGIAGLLSYQWKADGTVIAGATASSYTLTHAEIGKVVTMEVSYTDALGTHESVSSLATASVLALDNIAPVVTSFSPSDAATSVAVNSDIVFTFSEAVQRGTGVIEIHSGSATGTLVESFDAATDLTHLTLSGSTLTINPTADLQQSIHYFVTAGAGSIKDISGNNYAGTTSYDFTTIGYDLTGAARFWKTGALISVVTNTLSTAPVVAASQPVEFRNVQLNADGSHTVELWETSVTAVENVNLTLILPGGSTATWTDSATLPTGWVSSPNTLLAGEFNLSGMGLITSSTALSAGSVKLGTLKITAQTDPSHFTLQMASGLLNNTDIAAFGMVSDKVTTGVDGAFQYLDMPSGTYTLGAVKAVDQSVSNAVKSNDALMALKIAVGQNPNADSTAVLPYQYLAADVNKDGRVMSNDALNILKMASKLPTSLANEWLFVSDAVGQDATMTRTSVHWPANVNSIPVTLDHTMDLQLIGIVKGDVNGSWVA